MNLHKQIILVFALLFTVATIAQDKIQLMNGKVLRGKLKTESDGMYGFEYYKNGGSAKSIELSKYRMFSITNTTGEETVLYKQDTLMGNFFSENEMRMYIYGQRDAFKNSKGTPYFVTTFALGFASVMLDTYDGSNSSPFFSREPSIAPIIVPLAVTIGTGLIRTKVRKEQAADVTFLSSEHYLDGYQKVARVKRVKSAFFGSVSGVIAGFIVYAIGKP